MPINDVINSATPVENELLGVHPRIFYRESDFNRLVSGERGARQNKTLNDLILFADEAMERPMPLHMQDGDIRSFGAYLTAYALLYRVSGDKRYLDASLKVMRHIAPWENWGDDLIFGHFANGFACALDWLWEEFDKRERDVFCDHLVRHVEYFFGIWSSCRSGAAYSYTWNHHTVPLSGMVVAAAVLHGERDEVSRWFNLGLEKLRCIHAALGTDGVSAESVAYGAYFAHYYLRSLIITRELLGVDIISKSEWLKNYSEALVQHTLAQKHWNPEEIFPNNTFIMLGDTDGEHWNSPDALCYVLASEYQDPYAQWIGDAVNASQVDAFTGDKILSLNRIDERLEPKGPRGLPKLKHYEDHGIAIGRSDWQGDEDVYVIRSGAPMALSAHDLHRNPVAGGHMQAFAGSFQIHADGQPLIEHSRYTAKRTEYNNTLLINGKGQHGESTAWYEDLHYRHQRVFPSLKVLRDERTLHHVMADATPAYPEELGLSRFHRHMLYTPEGGWVIVDDIEANEASQFSLCFHSPIDFEVREGFFDSRYEILSDANAPLAFSREEQTWMFTDGKSIRHKTNLLKVENPHPVNSMQVVTRIRRLAQSSGLSVERSNGRIRMLGTFGSYEFALTGAATSHLQMT